jgi:hypothetical protein
MSVDVNKHIAWIIHPFVHFFGIRDGVLLVKTNVR